MAATFELIQGAAGFRSHFDHLKSQLEGVGSPALHETRKQALEQWEASGFPTVEDEEWKYTSLRSLAETTLKPASRARLQTAELGSLVAWQVPGPRLVFVNGFFDEELSDTSSVGPGVTIGSLRQALQEANGVVTQYLGRIASLEGKLGSTNDERFKHLNTAFLAEGAFVHLSRGAVAEATLQVMFIQTTDEPMAVHPRVLIVAEKNSQASVLESYIGRGDSYLTNAVTEVHVEKNAILEHVRYQHESRGAYHIGLVAVHQEEDSTYTSYNTSFGGQVGRTDVNLWLNGEHTESRLDGVYVASGTQVLDNKTRIDHAKPNCHSFEVYKGILADRGTGVFNGKIFVYEDAQKTDAKQTNQALLLSERATINTKPQLEIFADDVKCTHGATVGQLRKDAMFYLRARGVPEKEAQALLVYAFAAEVLERINSEEVKVALEKVLYKKLQEDTDLETLEGTPVEE